MHVSRNVRVFLTQKYVTKLWVTKGKILINKIKKHRQNCMHC